MFLLHQSQLPLDPSTWPQTASGPPERLPHCRARCPVWPASAPTPAQQVLEDLQALKPTVFRRKSGDDRMSGDEIGWYGSTLSTTNGWVNTNTNMEEFCRLIDIQIVAHSLARWDICLRFSLRQHFHLGKIYTDNDIGCPSNLMESSWLCFSLNEPELGTWNSRRCILFPLMFKKNLANSAQVQNHTWPADPYPHGKKWFLSMRMILSDRASCGACLVYTTIQFGSPSSSILGTWLGHEKSGVEKENGTPIAIAHWQRGVVCQQTLGFNDVTNEHGGSKSKRATIWVSPTSKMRSSHTIAMI